MIPLYKDVVKSDLSSTDKVTRSHLTLSLGNKCAYLKRALSASDGNKALALVTEVNNLSGLTLALNMDPETARAINLLFFLPAAILSATLSWQHGTLPLKKIWPAMVSGAVSAALFTLLSQRLDVGILKKAFGILLLATGIRELLYRQKNEGRN